MSSKTVLERAYELAESGDVQTMTELKEQLRGEGYAEVVGHFEGKAIKNQLMGLMRTATASR